MDYFEYVYAEAAEFISGGWYTFIVPIAWTFQESVDSTVYAVAEFFGISQ